MVNPFKKTKTTRALFFMAADAIAVAFAGWASFLLRFDGHVPAQYDAFLLRLIVIAIFIVVPVFYIRRLYSFSWSYVSSGELISVFVSTTAAFLIFSGAIFISDGKFLLSFEFDCV